jgi:hypothetical protein
MNLPLTPFLLSTFSNVFLPPAPAVFHQKFSLGDISKDAVLLRPVVWEVLRDSRF